MSESKLVIRRHDPLRRNKLIALAAAAVILVFVAGLLLGWFWNTNARVTRSQYQDVLNDLQNAYVTVNDLRDRAAVLKSSEQVARNANRALRNVIAGLQKQIAAMQADLNVYRGLAGAGSGQSGLTVHRLILTPAGSPNLFDYTLTLAQNLEEAEPVKGTVEIVIEGTRAGELVRVGLAQMRPRDAAALTYTFKYFQVMEGALLLPGGFAPDRVEVRLVPENPGNETVVADFAWSDVVQRASISSFEATAGEQSNDEQH